MKSYRHFLITYLHPLWPQATILLLLLLLNTGLRLLSPQILASFIDLVVNNGGFQQLLQLALIFLGVALLTQVIAVAEHYLATNVGLLATNQLRADLTLHCLKLDMTFHNNKTPGELIERVDGDVGHLNHFFARFMVDFLGNAILMIGIFIVLLQVDWRVGIGLIVFAGLTLFLLYRLRDVAVPHFQAEREASANVFGFLEERLSGTEDIRASGANTYVMGRFHQISRHLFRKLLKANLIGASIYSITVLSFALTTVLALGLGIYLFLFNLITIGTVYLIYRYAELLQEPIEQIGRQVQDLQRAGAAMIRIQEILTVQSRLPDTGQTPLPAHAFNIVFDQVSFRYDDSTSQQEAALNVPFPEQSIEANQTSDPVITPIDRPVLDSLSFSLPTNNVLGLLGRTGSGKTTLTRLLFRLYEPTDGEIRLGGINLPQIEAETLNKGIGLVTQEIQLFHASVRHNLTLFDNMTIPDAQMIDALQTLGLGAWYKTLPEGLDTVLAPGSGNLSAGEAQLLAFVRVFLRDPALVILDEASSRLDPATEQVLEQAIDRLLADRTGIIIAHRLSTVQRADYIMILEAGQCIEYDQRTQLLADPNSRFSQLLQTGLEEALA